MKKILLIWFVVLTSVCVAQVDEFELFKAQREAELRQLRENDSAGFALVTMDFQDYLAKEKQESAEFFKECSAIWNENNITVSTEYLWVEYYANKQARSIVDFSTGEGKYQIIFSANTDVNKIKRLVIAGLAQVFVTQGTTKDYDTELEKNSDLLPWAVLEGQIKTPDGADISISNCFAAAKDLVEQNGMERKEFFSNGKKKLLYTVNFKLIENHANVRRDKFLPTIKKYCKKYHVDPNLVVSIIMTKTAFNPKAFNKNTQAVGLMQIIPNEQGSETVRQLKKKFSTPTKNYLFNATNNIEMGVCFLYILENNYLSKINDIKSKELCIIVAYECGVSNLSKMLTNNANIAQTIPFINSMPYGKFEKELLSRLPSPTMRTVNMIRIF